MGHFVHLSIVGKMSNDNFIYFLRWCIDSKDGDIDNKHADIDNQDADTETVSDPETEIVGGPDMFIDQGSTINLTCVARFTPGHPKDVLWYHDNEVGMTID